MLAVALGENAMRGIRGNAPSVASGNHLVMRGENVTVAARRWMTRNPTRG
jgi:hypothetical protein